jgi:hypothetical protein
MRSATLARSIVLVATIVPLSAARAADDQATASARFGRSGSAVVELGLVAGSRTEATDTTSETHSYQGAANLRLFIHDNWAVGLGVGASRIASSFADGSTTSTSFRIGPRLGRLIPVGSFVSILPEIGLGYARSSSVSNVPVIGGTPSPSWSIEIVAPILLHASRYFYVAAGPGLGVGLSSAGQSVMLAARLNFGFSFDAGG